MASQSFIKSDTFVQSDQLPLEQTIGASISEMMQYRFFVFTKRTMDVIGSLCALILLSPIMIITALLIKLDSPGPVFFMPTRVGKGGKLFKMIKFRSMRMYQIDGHVVHADELLKKDQALLSEYKKNSYKLKNDPRVTKIGRFIRKYSIDEFPQFFNILRGDMSLVGPRAYLPNELIEQQEVYPDTKPLVKTLLLARPGLSGKWQVSGRSEINFDVRIRMDAEYVEKRSIVYDIKILLLTVPALLTGRGAV
jgi:lipopolysaccharide/colanic/teichoic acid biosynthesis glycosyltransferase